MPKRIGSPRKKKQRLKKCQDFSELTAAPIFPCVPGLFERVEFRYAVMAHEWQKLCPSPQDLKRLWNVCRGEKARWADDIAQSAKRILFNSVQKPGERMGRGRTRLQEERAKMYELHQRGQSYRQIANVMEKTGPQVKAAVTREKAKRAAELAEAQLTLDKQLELIMNDPCLKSVLPIAAPTRKRT
jgi:hypothetical protein